MSDSEDQFHEYVCSYRYQGAEWGFSIMATSDQDAEIRLAQIVDNGQVDGMLGGRIPAGPAPGLTALLLSLICWLRNRIRNPFR